MASIGERVQQLRKINGFSTAELAKRAQWDRPNLHRLQQGKGGFSRESIQRLAQALGVPTAALFEENSNISPAPMGTVPIPLLDPAEVIPWRTDPQLISPYAQVLIAQDQDAQGAFAIRVRDESMAPLFTPGDVVVVYPAVPPSPGDFVVADCTGMGVFFRQYRERERSTEGGVRFDLYPLNEWYPVIRSDAQAIQILGTMNEHRRYRKQRQNQSRTQA